MLVVILSDLPVHFVGLGVLGESHDGANVSAMNGLASNRFGRPDHDLWTEHRDVSKRRPHLEDALVRRDRLTAFRHKIADVSRVDGVNMTKLRSQFVGAATCT